MNSDCTRRYAAICCSTDLHIARCLRTLPCLAYIRYLPYGHIEEVVPYLVRRAEENSSLMGGVAKDKDILFKEIRARITGKRAQTTKMD